MNSTMTATAGVTSPLDELRTFEAAERLFRQFCWDNGFPAVVNGQVGDVAWTRRGTPERFQGYFAKWNDIELTWYPGGTCTIAAPFARQVGVSLERIRARFLISPVYFDDDTLRGLVIKAALDEGQADLTFLRVIELLPLPGADPHPGAVLTVQQLLNLVRSIATNKPRP